MIRFAAPVCWPPELESTTVVPAAQQGSTSTPVVALVLFGIFVLLAAVGRALIQYRRTGDTGFRRDAAGASSVSGVGGWSLRSPHRSPISSDCSTRSPA
jgi:hypothetical protein